MAYTNIDDPSAYFQTVLWTGDGSAGNAVTFDGNSDMQPDFVWSKRRDVGYSHVLKDTSRGGTSNNDLHLVPDLTNAESTYAAYRMDFNSDGFTLDGAGDSGFQGSGSSMVSWSWKANGGTTSSNTDGSITSTVQANQDAGFSIVTYTGGGSAGTIGHGLGAKPKLIILKKRNGAVHWYVRHDSTGSSHLVLSLTAAAASVPSVTWTTTEPTSSVFSIGSGADFNANGGTFIAYCFAEKQGYSKFGKYVGNGSTNGPFVYTGFKPAFVMIKKSSSTGQWLLFDNARDPSNKVFHQLRIITAAESTITHDIDFLSNGFKIRDVVSNDNGSGDTFIYMAFAENPFVTSTGIPTTAR